MQIAECEPTLSAGKRLTVISFHDQLWLESIGHFNREGLGVATKTIERFVAHAVQLYEKEPGEAFAPSRLGKFVRRWIR